MICSDRPTLFCPKWMSHELQGPGVCHMVALSLDFNSMVWFPSPYPCGSLQKATNFLLTPCLVAYPRRKSVCWQRVWQHTLQNARLCQSKLESCTLRSLPPTGNMQQANEELWSLENRIRHNKRLNVHIFHAVAQLFESMFITVGWKVCKNGISTWLFWNFQNFNIFPCPKYTDPLLSNP